MKRVLASIALLGLLGGCSLLGEAINSSASDPSKWSYLKPVPIDLPMCTDWFASKPPSIVVIYVSPRPFERCLMEKGRLDIGHMGYASHYLPIDGVGASSGTYYSIDMINKNDKTDVQYDINSWGVHYDDPDTHTETDETLTFHGLKWRHRFLREIADADFPPHGPNQGTVSHKGDTSRLIDEYVSEPAPGWMLRFRVRFAAEMETHYPTIYASRRASLRTMVESVQIEPFDPAAVGHPCNNGCPYTPKHPVPAGQAAKR